MSFLDILSQNAPVQTLRRSLATGKTAHAYLFSGPPGVGKHLAARTMAAALNCTERSDDACGTCASCRKIAKDVHPDVFELGVPPTKKTIPVDSIREVEKRLSLRPHEGRAKVVIIDPSDMMTEAAANALLKTLEEPGPGRYLLLITARLSYLLPTVRSRCQKIRFGALPETVVEQLLMKQGAAQERAAAAAALSHGSMTRAVSYLDDATVDRVFALLSLLACATSRTPLEGMQVIESLKKSKDGARDESLSFIQTAPAILSEILWLANHSQDDLSLRPLVRIFGDRLLPLVSTLSTAQIAAFVYAFHHAEQSILNNNMNPQLALEGVLMSIRSPLLKMGAGSGFRRI